MLIRSRRLRGLGWVGSMILLAQCSISTHIPAAKLAPHNQTFDMCMALNDVAFNKDRVQSINSSDAMYQQQLAMLRASGKALAQRNWKLAEAILAQIDDLDPQLAREKLVLKAVIAVQQKKAQHAIDLLLPLEQQSPASSLLARVVELHAQANHLLHQPKAEVLQRLRLTSLLASCPQYQGNQKKLWLAFTQLTTAELKEWHAQSHSKELKGYLELVLMSRTRNYSSSMLAQDLSRWVQNHPQLHAVSAIQSIDFNKQIQRIALLLPLTGVFQGPGNAVKKGFEEAQAAVNNKSIRIKSYDTAGADIVSVYQKAIQDGADFVVGPLVKSQVNRLNAIEHPIPTLLLNEPSTALKTNSYSFSLSAQNEVMHLVRAARNKNLSQAILITPDSEWGNELKKSFVTQWAKHSGILVASYAYGLKDDFNLKIKELLHLNQSEVRGQQIKALLGSNIETPAYRRQDFDVIFVVAYPSAARQIIPLLKYYYAGNIPIYATASVYSGSMNAIKDKDLDQLLFYDIPWVFSHQLVNPNWPEQFNSYNRLYALGRDSYNLVSDLHYLHWFPYRKLSQDEGYVFMNSNHHILRVLELGQFRQGLIHSMELLS